MDKKLEYRKVLKRSFEKKLITKSEYKKELKWIRNNIKTK